jgi:hypothetical protein
MTRDECTSRPDCACEFCKQPALDAIILQWIEQYRDRAEDARVFGTVNKETIQ